METGPGVELGDLEGMEVIQDLAKEDPVALGLLGAQVALLMADVVLGRHGRG